MQNAAATPEDGSEVNTTEITEGTRKRKRESLTPEKSTNARHEWILYRRRARINGQTPIPFEEYRLLNSHQTDRPGQVQKPMVSLKMIYVALW